MDPQDDTQQPSTDTGMPSAPVGDNGDQTPAEPPTGGATGMGGEEPTTPTEPGTEETPAAPAEDDNTTAGGESQPILKTLP